MKTTKKVLSVFLAILLTFACTAVAFAADFANYVVYNNTVTAFESLKYNKGYQQLCVPEYVDFIDAVLAENELPDGLEASQQHLVNEAVANIEAAKAELLTDKFLKASTPDINSTFAQINELFAALGDLTDEQQARVDELEALVNEMKADKNNVSKAELDSIIKELEEIKNYIDSTNAADYSKYDYEVASFAMLKDNRAYQELCIPAFSAYIDEILAEVALPRDLTVAEQNLINEAIDKIAAARAILISDEYIKASASDIDSLIAEIEGFIAGLEDLTAAEQAKVDKLQADIDAIAAEGKENVSRKDLADILAALENLKYELDDTRAADYTKYDIEVRTFSDLRYNRAYLELCIPAFIDYIDQVLEEVALPRDLTVKDQYLIDEAIEKLQDARNILFSDEYMKADENEIDELIAEIEKVLDDIISVTDEVKDEVDALKNYLDELKNNKENVSKNDLQEILDALKELKELLKDITSEPADYTDYNYWYPQITARAQHPWYYEIFDASYAQIVEEFIAEVTIPENLPAYKQYIIDEAVEKLLAFDEKLKNEDFTKEEAEAEVETIEESADCDCFCHGKGIISRLTSALIRALKKLLGIQDICNSCADAH